LRPGRTSPFSALCDCATKVSSCRREGPARSAGPSRESDEALLHHIKGDTTLAGSAAIGLEVERAVAAAVPEARFVVWSPRALPA
ncbi:MAG: hypothetical protein M0Z34_07340, partial [Nitrospiraceae bacterium]|nr:hypothetical protein [Nitrospiraceae bacterium]